MPIYEYECLHCGHRFEVLVLSSSPAPECPSCQQKNLKQLISLCAMSSETTRESSFNSAHKKARAAGKGKQHEEHQSMHEHFHDELKPKPNQS
jgi:putative FmdB family regulatory protein